jgi:hypothetical protein
MQSNGLSFHHPVAFWLGCAAVVAGVLAHMPMFAMGRMTHWRMVGMLVDNLMLTGMALIPLGLLLATFGLMPRLEQMPQTLHRDRQHLPSGYGSFHITDGVPLNGEHWKLVSVLVVALAIDVMKPATLGFVVPGMSAEYQISKPTASLLALVLAFFAMGLERLRSATVTIAATAGLLVSVSGVIAMLIPYAMEIYPAHLRGTGSGVIAAASKFGGILGAGLGVLGLLGNFMLSALLIAVPMAISGVLLWRGGIETRGQQLEDIQEQLSAHRDELV